MHVKSINTDGDRLEDMFWLSVLSWFGFSYRVYKHAISICFLEFSWPKIRCPLNNHAITIIL